MIVYLVRHGKDDSTVRGGWTSHGLTQEGVAQVHTLAEELRRNPRNIRRIYSSDLPRAAQTADILATVLDLPIRLLPGFREVNNGDLAGMDNGLAMQRYPDLFWSSLGFTESYPNGESPERFYRRVQEAWRTFKEDALRHPSEDIILVTHGGVIEAILCMENGIEYTNMQRHFAAPNATLIPIEILPERPRL